MSVTYAEDMKKKQAERGRPRMDPLDAFTLRHVVNISPRMEKAVQQVADENGIRLPDAIRLIMTRYLKDKELL
jgi:hypothetical protein